MAFAVELYFDDAAETAVRHIWQSLTDNGHASPLLNDAFTPHISLAVYDTPALEQPLFNQNLAEFVQGLRPFPFRLSHIGIFATAESVVFLGATATPQLLTVHKQFHEQMTTFASMLRPYYAPGNWVPHCTITYGETAVAVSAALPILCKASLPINGRIQSVGLVQVSPTHVKELKKHPLSKGKTS